MMFPNDAKTITTLQSSGSIVIKDCSTEGCTILESSIESPDGLGTLLCIDGVNVEYLNWVQEGNHSVAQQTICNGDLRVTNSVVQPAVFQTTLVERDVNTSFNSDFAVILGIGLILALLAVRLGITMMRK